MKKSGSIRPELAVISGPETSGVFLGGAEDGEAFRPHELGEEGGDADLAVARDAVRCAQNFKLLLRGEMEEALALELKSVKKVSGDAVPGYLKHAPRFAGFGEVLQHVRVLEIDDGDVEVLGLLGEGMVRQIRPSVGVWEFSEFGQVEEEGMVLGDEMGSQELCPGRHGNVELVAEGAFYKGGGIQ